MGPVYIGDVVVGVVPATLPMFTSGIVFETRTRKQLMRFKTAKSFYWYVKHSGIDGRGEVNTYKCVQDELSTTSQDSGCILHMNHAGHALPFGASLWTGMLALMLIFIEKLVCAYAASFLSPAENTKSEEYG
jgi:hypothetical protein